MKNSGRLEKRLDSYLLVLRNRHGSLWRVAGWLGLCALGGALVAWSVLEVIR